MIIGAHPAQGLDDTNTIRKFGLSRLCNGGTTFLSVNATKMHQFKAKGSEIKKNIPYFIFSSNKMKKAGLIFNFSIDYVTFYSSDIIDLHKYFMKNTRYKIVFGLIKKICDYELA